MSSNELQSEILFIKRIMEDSRRSMAENGIGYIIWGILVVIGIIFNYLRLIDVSDINPLYTWIVVIGAGWIITFISIKKERKETQASSLGNQVLGGVWLSAGLIMTTIGFLGSISKTIPGFGIIPLMCCVLAIAFYVSGIVYKENLIKLSGLGWWLAAITFFLWHSVHSLLVFAILMLLLQVLPGLYFYKKWKQEYLVLNKEQEIIK